MDIEAWMKQQMVAAEVYDADALIERFLEEMERGLKGENSSLAMRPSYVGGYGKLPFDKPVAVIDAGGTNLRIGIAQFNNAGKLELSGFTRQPMPGRNREVAAAEFYAVLADALEPLKNRFDHIGFCFSYPVDILPSHDGKLLHWTKEIQIPELVGCRIGAGLLEALEQRGVTGKRVVLLNDTVATLLAGMAQGASFNASSYIGFILGTGTNTAYIECNEQIVKLDGPPASGAQVVNVESGGFSIFDRGPADLQLDARSENSGRHIFEKSISGAYLGALALELMQTLAAEGVFSAAGGVALAIMKTLSTVHIDNLVKGDGDIDVLGSAAFTDADREIMKVIFAAVVDRAALFTAANLTAAVVKCGAGKNPDQPVCINIDGSTYYKTTGLADKVQEHLATLLKKRGLHARCIHVPDSPIAGAVAAALTTL